MLGDRTVRIAVCLVFIALIALGVAGVETALAQNNARGSRSDPPGLGKVTLKAGQKIRLNVTCFDHEIGKIPPDPCHGEVMLSLRAPSGRLASFRVSCRNREDERSRIWRS